MCTLVLDKPPGSQMGLIAPKPAPPAPSSCKPPSSPARRGPSRRRRPSQLWPLPSPRCAPFPPLPTHLPAPERRPLPTMPRARRPGPDSPCSQDAPRGLPPLFPSCLAPRPPSTGARQPSAPGPAPARAHLGRGRDRRAPREGSAKRVAASQPPSFPALPGSANYNSQNAPRVRADVTTPPAHARRGPAPPRPATQVCARSSGRDISDCAVPGSTRAGRRRAGSARGEKGPWREPGARGCAGKT